MISLSRIVEEFEGRLSIKYQQHILPSHKKALAAIKRCRKSHGPQMLVRCSNQSCQQQAFIPHSCGHRSCPHCQNHENQQWIENQLSKQLPAQYYLITFTLPAEMRHLAFRNHKLVYSLMLKTVQELLKKFTRNDKQLTGEAGFTTVLHTHSRRLDYHPHIHVVMVGGSINKQTRCWRSKSGKYLFNHKALAKVFRAVLLREVVALGLQLPQKIPKEWVTHCKNVGNGAKALIYLGSYLYKGVISEKDIVRSDNKTVTFRYRDSKSKSFQTRSVPGEYFLWLLMQHVLPTGFRKVRCYGFLHPCSKKLIKLLQLLLRFNPAIMRKKLRERAGVTCKKCGAAMDIICTMIPGSKAHRALTLL